MAASTIPNSGGPGSSIELSPVTIAVRDKVIEKFVDQPLDEMNESVKQLLAREEDEQKRLGILAARVYILRQRIARIAEGDPERVVGSAAPKPSDLVPGADGDAGGETAASEWTRLRILDDCEVNGVRFPKTVIIDVKSEDADRLIASGSAELVEEAPASSAAATDEAPAETAAVEAPDTASDETDGSAETEGSDETAAAATDDATDDGDDGDDPSALSAALDEAPAPQMVVEDPPQPDAEADVAVDQEATGEAVIETPSAAEVTAALEALSGGDNDGEAHGGESDDSAAAVADAGTRAETAGAEDNPEDNPEDNADEAADVTAELEALSAALAPEEAAAPETVPESAETDDAASDSDSDSDSASDSASETPGEATGDADSEAADVAAELEAAAAAMAAGPNTNDTSDLPPADGEDEARADSPGKPAGWFEAQQNAEASKRGAGKAEDEDA